MNEEERRLSDEAFRWIKKNERVLTEKFASPDEHEPDPAPVSLFMAGSPGAGKTELSKQLAQGFATKPVRIDADEIRSICPGYHGDNANVFQRAAVKGVHILHEHSLQKKLNFILDGTFAYDDVQKNIKRSLDRWRKVKIFYVYQNPIIAWEFTKKRERLEGRRVTKEVFIDAYIKARANVSAVKQAFGDQVELNLMVKDVQKGYEHSEFSIADIDPYVDEIYTRNNLESIIL